MSMGNQDTGVRPYEQHSLRYASLPELVWRIACCCDRMALRELCDNRTPFRIEGGPPLHLAEFVAGLAALYRANPAILYSDSVLEMACKRVTCMFMSLPASGARARGSDSVPDCRPLFREALPGGRAADCSSDPLAAERAAALRLSEVVASQFRLSCIDAQPRGVPRRTLYSWRVKGGTLRVWMPQAFAGVRRREWLEANVVAPDPSRPGEYQRVQTIIYERLTLPRRMARRAGRGTERPAHDATGPMTPEQSTLFDEVTEAVVQYFAANPHLQRSKLRALGSDGARALILRVMGEMSKGSYDILSLLREFGGDGWTSAFLLGGFWPSGPVSRPADLWLVLAQVLAKVAPFVEAAQATGIWDQLQSLLEEHGLAVKENGR